VLLRVEIVNTSVAVFAWRPGIPGPAMPACLRSRESAFDSKYGIVPELVKPDHLCQANASLEALTYGASCWAPPPVGPRPDHRRPLRVHVWPVVIATAGLLPP
jgi:hypothetical protein